MEDKREPSAAEKLAAAEAEIARLKAAQAGPRIEMLGVTTVPRRPPVPGPDAFKYAPPEQVP